MVQRRFLFLAAFFGAVISGNRLEFGWLPAVPCATADEPAAAPKANDLPPRAIHALILQLGDPQFVVREEATKALEQAGVAAVEPLLAAAAGENLEVTCRAIRVLSRLFDSNDEATFDLVELALERLEQSPNRSAARRAAEALAAQSARRWKRAAARIKELGGELRSAEQNGNLAFAIQDERAAVAIVVIPPEWKGGDAGLVNLKRMVRPDYPNYGLPNLYIIDGAPVSAAGIEKLCQALPGLRDKIQHRGAARLGISCFAELRTCRVSGVEKNSPAARAGIQRDDEIVRFDGESLTGEDGKTGFEKLIEITGKHKAGDKIALEVLRAGTLVQVEAELTGWTTAKPDEQKK